MAQPKIRMTHPGITGYAVATQRAFDTIYALNGWVKIGSDDPATAPVGLGPTAPAWAASTIYGAGQVASNPTTGELIRRKTAGTSRASFDATEQTLWVEPGTPGAYAPISSAWQANTAYKAGELVTNGGVLYAANADFTSGATFSATNWTAIVGGGSAGPFTTTPAVGALTYLVQGAPGTDVTAELQAAINAANTAQVDIDILFWKPGVYLINGASQTGSVTIGGHTYNYAGQILIPAQPFTSGRLSVRIRGLTPAPIALSRGGAGGEPQPTGGVILLSNATSGYIFDAIPATDVGTPFTDYVVTYKDITIRSPNNPQNGGIKGFALAGMKTEGCVSVDVNASGTASSATKTGTLCGIVWPTTDNMCLSRQSGDLLVMGYPIGVQPWEHMVFDNFVIQNCNIAIQANGSGHIIRWNRAAIQSCPTILQAVGSPKVHGIIDMETDATLLYVIDDTGNGMSGDLIFNDHGGDIAGMPVRGAQNVNFGIMKRGSRGWMGEVPYDTFTRLQGYANGPLGACDTTCHPWRTLTGNWNTSVNGQVQIVPGTTTISLCPWFARQPAVIAWGSRIVRATLTTAATLTDAGIVIGYTSAITASANYFRVTLDTTSRVTLYKVVSGTRTTLAQTGTGKWTPSTAVTLEAVCRFSGNPGAAQTISIFLGSTLVLSYTLTAQDITDMAQTALGSLRYDGLIAGADDNLSTFTSFAVAPLSESDTPFVNSGTATFAAGTVTVADPLVTANTRIKVYIRTPGGVVGAPFVSALTPGTGFVITSTSATDTSVVLYEVESY